MNKPFAPITGILLALSVAACGSSSSSSQQGGSSAIVAGSGGKGVGNGGSSSIGGSPVGNGGASSAGGGSSSGGVPIGNGGASSVSDSGGNPSGDTGGTAASNTGGSPSNNTGGVAAGNTGGSPTGTTGGNPSGNTGGTSAGNTLSNTGGTKVSTGGSPAGNTGGGPGSSGGQPTATGGGTSTGPLFITSAQNAYWKTGQVTTLASGTANITVDDTTKYQSWSGFGGCFNEMGWDALSVVSSQIPAAMKLLFDAQDGANFTYGRLPMGASDYAMSWYTLDDTSTADYSMTSFSIARDQQKLIPYIQAALQVKSNIHLWASPWVVPAWMMDSSSNMKSDAQTLTAHALYMARFVEEYAKLGLNIEAIHPQNEPGYARVHWTQANLITFMKTYLGPTLAQRNLTTQLWCGTMSKDPDDTNIALAASNDSAAMQYIKGFGVQWNLEAAVNTLRAKAPVMQTEHRCGNYNFASTYWDQTRYNPNMPQNDHLYGEESWQLIRDWIVSGVNSYSAWNMVLDTIGMSLDKWPQNALLVVDRNAKTLTATAAYYAFRHYSQYILPGATRIGVSGSTDAVAFQNADGSIVTEVYNKGSSAQTLTVKVSNTLYQFSVPSHGWATLRIAS